MKKKILLIAVVIFVSIGLLSISKIVQNKYIDKNIVSTEKSGSDKTSQEAELKEDDKENQSTKDTTENPVKEDVKPVVQGDIPKVNVKDKTVEEQKPVVDSKKDVSTTVTKSPTENVTPTKEVTKDTATKAPEPKKEPNLTVRDDISGKTILSINVSTENKTVAEVTFNALDNSGISYKSTGRGEVIYFTMINNLKARDEGPLSGWCYYVNGVKSSVSCGAYKLKAGDVVSWKYLKDGVNN